MRAEMGFNLAFSFIVRARRKQLYLWLQLLYGCMDGGSDKLLVVRSFSYVSLFRPLCITQ